MSKHTYTEDQLVEQPAIQLFTEMNWTTLSAMEEILGPDGTLGRETKGEVILPTRLRVALTKLNPSLPEAAITTAMDELTRDRSAMGLPNANREIYDLLKNGIRVSVVELEAPPLSPPLASEGDRNASSPSPSGRGIQGEGLHRGGGQRLERVRVIDWEHPDANDFLLVSQFSVTGALYTCRPDLVGFVNGLPLVVIELKKPGIPARQAFDGNLTHYKQQIPALFWYNALLIASNGTDSRVGSLTADWDRFFEWKRIESENEPRRVSLEVMLRGTCDKNRLLDLAENFTLFSEHKAGLVKILGQNHQVLGVNSAIKSMLRIREDLTNPATLTPGPSPKLRTLTPASPRGRGAWRGEKERHYRGGFEFSGMVERARQLRQQQTPAEDVVWELLRDRQFAGLKFRRQHQIGNYIADFFCVELKLVIEIDGGIHTAPKVIIKDAQRNAYLRSMGFNVLRFQNQLVLDNPEAFLQQLATYLPSIGSSPSSSPYESQEFSLQKFPSTSGRGARGEGNTPIPNGIGVFWQTQGSGKSFSMVFFAQKILRKSAGNWTFVVVTDRIELDEQIAKTFKAVGAVSASDGDECHASSGAHLRELLRGNHRYIFSLVHKFQPERLLSETPSSPALLPEGRQSQMPLLSDRRDIIVIVDEAHRTQYDTLAMNMRAALPRALFVAFTGTPLIVGEERTKEVFGDYVSIYDFQQSVEDGATVPLYYENRTPELEIVNPDLNEDIYDVIEAAGLDPSQEEKLEKQLGRQYHILTRDDRLDTIARDIVHHFLGRGFVGKAMVVSIDKATALRMHDKVQKFWMKEIQQVKRELQGHYTLSNKQKNDLLDRLQLLQSTDMALIVSPGQNEIEQMKKLGLEIEPHRKRMNAEQLDEKFKDPDDPLRLVFLCAMWLTGFDAPSCSTIYLDKPMRNHTLMQTIARANRVFPGKHSGVIVDYANVFASLERALAIYGKGTGGDTPVRNKQKLVEELREAIKDATLYCACNGVDVASIEEIPVGDLKRLQLIDDAVNALISPDKIRKEFLAHERLVDTLYNAVKPDPAALEFSPRTASLATIAETIKTKLNPDPIDISEVLGQVQEVLDLSIAGVDIPDRPANIVDLSKIDFEKLHNRFKKSKHKNTDLERLKAAIRAQLEKMLHRNSTRADYLEKFEELIKSYNDGSRNIEQILEDLLNFAETLSEEEQRHVREHLSEEELTIFDILTRPGPELSPAERNEVKKVAQHVLERLKALLGLDWRRLTQARAKVRMAIEEELDSGLPQNYTRELFSSKCSALFEHVYESYYGEGRSVYEGRKFTCKRSIFAL